MSTDSNKTHHLHNPFKVSVVTASLNQGHLIQQCIESVISQKGDFEIEHLIMDGGSTDATISILQKYKDSLENGSYPIQCKKVVLKFISEKDSGQSSAMNKAIRLSTGDIIGEISTDDYYLPGAFETAVQFFKSHEDIDFVYGDCLKLFDADASRPSTFEPRPRPDESFESIRKRGSASFAMQASFFRSKILPEVGGFFDERFHYCPDLDFFLRVFGKVKAHYIPFPMAAFRIWEGSKTTNYQKKFAAERRIIAKRYGGNIISSHTIYAIRGNMTFLNYFKKYFPKTYMYGKKVFYHIINLFTY